MTEAIVSPLEKSIAKGSVQGILRAFINQENRAVHLDEFLKVLTDSGVEHTREKVYASLQALATNSKIDRGFAPNTYAPKNSIDQAEREARLQAEREAKASAVKEPREKKNPGRKKASAETYTHEAVFTHLIEQLGDPREYSTKTHGPAFVLLGDASGEHIIERFKLGFGSDPVAWTVSNTGPNPVVWLHSK